MEKINRVTADEIKIISNVLNDLLKTSVMEITSQIARMEMTEKNNTNTVNIIAAVFFTRLFIEEKNKMLIALIESG